MNRDMFGWLEDIKAAKIKKALPILSFPATQLMGITVRELIADSERQAEGIRLIAARNDAYAANSLMDLSVEAECFGAQIRFSDNEIPTVIGSCIDGYEQAEALRVPEVGCGRTGIYVDAIRKAAVTITDRPVFGCTIGPFSLAGRLVGVTDAMIKCYEEPETMHLLLEKATEFIIAYCLAYKRAGANGTALAEPLAGMMSPALAQEFSCTYVKRIVDAVQDQNFIVLYHNCGNATVHMLDHILGIGAAAYHFGNAIKMIDVLERAPANTVVMGNLDPAGQLRDGTPDSVRAATEEILNACGKYDNFVISSGCDVPPAAKWENIDTFFDTVREYYAGK